MKHKTTTRLHQRRARAHLLAALADTSVVESGCGVRDLERDGRSRGDLDVLRRPPPSPPSSSRSSPPPPPSLRLDLERFLLRERERLLTHIQTCTNREQFSSSSYCELNDHMYDHAPVYHWYLVNMYSYKFVLQHMSCSLYMSCMGT